MLRFKLLFYVEMKNLISLKYFEKNIFFHPSSSEKFYKGSPCQQPCVRLLPKPVYFKIFSLASLHFVPAAFLPPTGAAGALFTSLLKIQLKIFVI